MNPLNKTVKSNCQAGHLSHDSKIVNTVIGEMHIFDYPKYMNFQGYCTGQDEVSKSLDLNGTWDTDIFNAIQQIANNGTKGLFVDIGCHIGWFSRFALLKGFDVESYDGDADNLKLLEKNAPKAKKHFAWFEAGVEPTGLIQDINILKIDIEGNEQWAIRYFENSIKAKKVKHIIMEVTPVFNDSYPALVQKLQNYGYEVQDLHVSKWDGKFDFDQTDLLFTLK